MGGCRCTYKNCTVRSDGFTHMFHYPVFDKVRCHQWLTNAQKLEFLNLKVSQLKNRVVCQYHFKSDNFMNFLNDKLTFDAVPTEDGPYCDSSQLVDNKTPQEEAKVYTIAPEDIEMNEYLTFNDKRANFSVKYGDFLTNCDLMDLDSITSDSTLITKDRNLNEDTDTNSINNTNKKQNVMRVNPTVNLAIDALQPAPGLYTIHMSEVPIEIEQAQNEVNPNMNINSDNNLNQIVSPENVIQTKPTEPARKKNGRSLLKERKKITILDEKKIIEPMPVTFPVKLESVSPSAILQLPNKRRNLNTRPRDPNINRNNCKTIGAQNVVERNNVLEEVVNIEKKANTVKVVENLDNMNYSEPANIENRQTDAQALNVLAKNTPSNVIHSDNVKKPNNSLLKTRIPPERIAAIEEKRKFNMKLRDIIASCLDKLDDDESKKYDASKLSKSKIGKNITQKVNTFLAKEPELPNINDYSVAYLEARMKKMENILLHKIDQNTKRIIDLKESLTTPMQKKAVHTQTALNEEVQKKHLYQEISKYLSPEANSLLYEELFINKYAQKVQAPSPSRKRKYR